MFYCISTTYHQWLALYSLESHYSQIGGQGTTNSVSICSPTPIPVPHYTFPTAASPKRTSFTVLLGFGAVASAIVCGTLEIREIECTI
jgi:hypothetical protein